MRRSSREEVSGVLALLHEIYAAPDTDAFVRRLLEALPALTGSTIVGYNEYNPSRSRVWYVAEPAGADAPGGPSLFSRFTHEHPLIRHYRKTGDGRAYKLSDFLSRAQYQRLGLYNEYFRRCTPAVEDLIAVHFGESRGRYVAALALGRQKRNYSERERALLNLMRPHFGQAYRNIERVAELRRELAAAAGALEAVSQGVVALDRDGKARLANQRGRELLAQYVRPLSRGRLPADVQSWLSWQRKALDAERGLATPLRPFVVRRAERSLVIRLVREPGASAVLLLDERRSAPEPRELGVLGLSRRESEITSLLANGRTNKAIARLLDIAPKTVEKHLQHVYAKLGVSTRTAATARALAVVS